MSSSTCLDYAYESFTGAMLTIICVRSVAWSSSGKHIALGLVDCTIAVYERDSLQVAPLIGEPERCANAAFEVHHVNWVEEEFIRSGYHKHDEVNAETRA